MTLTLPAKTATLGIRPTLTTAYLSGTAYSLTNTAAAVTGGTTSPSITLGAAGTYRIDGYVNLKYSAATFAANQTVTLKFRRTNNTAADLTSGSTTATTRIITTTTDEMGNIKLPTISYTTTNTNDVVTIFASVGTAPSAGSLQIDNACIAAQLLY